MLRVARLVVAATLLAACHSSSDSTSADASVPGSADVTVVASGVTAYVANALTFDASASRAADGSPVTFAWSLESAPAGSAVTDVSIQGATSAVATLLPDVPGDYVLTVRAFASGNSSVQDVTSTAIDPLVFYTQAGLDGGDVVMDLHVAGASSDGGPSVMCPIAAANDGGIAQQFYGIAFEGAGGEVDTWEGSPGTPARVAFIAALFDADGGGTYQMFAATSDSSCATPPRAIGASISATTSPLAQPRFSPNGDRVARLEPTANGYVVSVVGFDGSGYRVLGAFGASGFDAGGFFEDQTILARPQWQDETHVGWLRAVSPASWEIVVASDSDGSAPQSYMQCQGARPRELAFLADGSVLTTDADAQGTLDLYVVTRACDKTRITNLVATNRARDFAVSPDGTRVAFLVGPAATDAGGGFDLPGGSLYVGNIDGGGVGPVLSNGATLNGVFGARWIGGGASLAWTRSHATNSSGNPFLSLSASVIPAGGGALHDVAAGDDRTTMVAAIGNGGCAIGDGRPTDAAWLSALAMLIFAAGAARRRSST